MWSEWPWEWKIIFFLSIKIYHMINPYDKWIPDKQTKLLNKDGGGGSS